MTDKLEFFCIVEGQSISRGFVILIDSTASISEFKNNIYSQIEHNGILAKDLLLWRVNLPNTTGIELEPLWLKGLEEVATDLTLAPPAALHNPRLPVSTVKIDATAAIIVQRPLQARPGNPSPPGSPLSGVLITDIDKITSAFFKAGSPAATFLDRFVHGHEKLPLTTGIIPGLPRAWVREHSLLSDTQPSLLFLNLPDPSTSNTPLKRSTADDISDLLKRCHTDIAPVFGVSGCGKTRGLIELLSLRWGFYFNASRNDMGSDDMSLLASTVRRYLKQDEFINNNGNAMKITYLLFLARLKIFNYCLTVPNSAKTFTCARWTLLQVCPHMFKDVFYDLFRKFLRLPWTTTIEGDITAVVIEEFEMAKNNLEQYEGLPRFLPDTQLLVAYDEAQVLAGMYDGSFQSLSEEESDRPLLSPVLHGFRNIGLKDLTLVTSGTGLSMYALTWAQNYGTINKVDEKKPEFQYMEFSGWTNRESIEAYIAGIRNVLQTEDARKELDKLLPPKAINMMMQRLVGRFRPIVSAIEKIIKAGNSEAWQDAIEDTEERLVSWEFHKSRGNLCYELVRLEDKYRKNMSTFEGLRTVEDVLGLLLFQRYMFGGDNLVLDKALPELVERAFGRIKITHGQIQTAVDEPFVLKAAENYFKARDSGFMKTIDWWMQQSNGPQAQGYAWELMMMNVLTETFKNHALSDWTHDPSIPSLCQALEGLSEIVGLNDQGSYRGISHKVISMEEFLDGHLNKNSLRFGQPLPPFFFPKTNPSGPDLAFYIRVNGKMFPVFVQLKLRRVISKKVADSALASVSSQKLKRHVSDLAKYCPSDKTFISMVIAYPGSLVKLLPPRPDFDPNAEDLKQVLIKVDDVNFAKIFPRNHVDYLDGIKDSIKRNAIAAAVDQSERDTKKSKH